MNLRLFRKKKKYMILILGKCGLASGYKWILSQQVDKQNTKRLNYQNSSKINKDFAADKDVWTIMRTSELLFRHQAYGG